ncbi:MAG: GDYXXLXY domain-containing protein [Nitrospirae bacterium]|nr:GDYXXLXY domain-containing protein [Nitrospirota bacterium]
MAKKFIAIVLMQAVLLVGIIAYRQYWVGTGEKVMLKTVPVDPWNMFRGDYMTLTYDISRINLTKLGIRDAYKRNDRFFALLQKQPDNTFEYSGISHQRPENGTFIQGRVTNVFDESRWMVKAAGDAGETKQFELRWFSGVNIGDRVLFCTHRWGQVDFQRFTEKYTPQCSREDESFSGALVESQEIKEKILSAEYGIESYFVEEGKGSIDALAKQQNTQPSQQPQPLVRGQSRLHVEAALRRDGKALISRIFIDNREVK